MTVLDREPDATGRHRSLHFVCRLSRLEIGRGACAFVAGRQVALFRTALLGVFAVDNRDPFSGAQILSRGIVGSRGDALTVSSPMYKQVFDLRTGACLDDPDVMIDVFGVIVDDEGVWVEIEGSAGEIDAGDVDRSASGVRR